MKDYNVQLEDLAQFLYILKRFNSEPHKVIETMIKHNQKMDDVRKYLQSMINHIDKEKE